LLAACATQKDVIANKNIDQSGQLKVHPALLGQPAPPELQAASRVASNQITSETPMRLDETGLRTQRSVYFDFNASNLKADYDPALQAHARYLANNPQARVRIEGHADERGSSGYNNRLALKRAESVRLGLIGHGAPEKRVLVKSLGESKPKLTGHDEDSWSENRRADVVYEREE
jgi:peptidoglycan-associated lipoprotein